MEKALTALREGQMGLNAVARLYSISKPTLRRHLLNLNKYANGSTLKRGRGTCLPHDFETELVEHVVRLEKMLFGISRKDLMKLAYELAERNGLQHVFSRDKKSAGKDWFSSFIKRHPTLFLRQPEATSLARSSGFNAHAVCRIFDILEKLIDEHHLTATRIYNVDETGLSTVQKCQKVVAMKGRHQVGAITSGERGTNTTGVFCISSSGVYIPPMLIFKRKRMKEELKDGAPAGTIFHCNDSGWMDTDGFNIWLRHFISVVKPTPQEKVLLLLDGHVSHTKNLEAILKARESGVIMLSLPPHTTHRLQPLDVSFFKPLQTYYGQEGEKWLRSHAGRGITPYHVSQLLGAAYVRAATMSNAVNGFRKCGIWPCDRHVFDDELQFISSITPAQPMCPTSSVSLAPDPATQGTGSAYSATASVEDHCYSAAAPTLSANDATVTGKFMFYTMLYDYRFVYRCRPNVQAIG